jgi:hypothetical protein
VVAVVSWCELGEDWVKTGGDFSAVCSMEVEMPSVDKVVVWL